MVRVIHFVHTLHGGVASVAATLINEQLQYGYKIMVAYCYDDPAFESMLDQKVELIYVPLSKRLGYSMLLGMNIPKIVNIVKTQYPNDRIIVHAHNVQTVGLFPNLSNIPHVCTLHSLRGNDKGLRPVISDYIYKLILRKICKQGGALTSVSKAISNFYNKENQNVTVVYNGVRCDGTRVDHQFFRIGHIGNISIAKGWDITSEGYSLIPIQERKNMLFVSAGKLRSYTQEELEKRIFELGIKETSTYLGFVNNASNVVLPTLDVLILASRNEGLGVCIIEAFGRGIPVIASKVGGIPEIVKDGVNGFLIDNAQDIADCLIRLYNDYSLYNAMSREAKKTFDSFFSSEKMFKSYNDIYMRLLS